MDDMPCQELVELVTDYLEGVLGSEQTERLNSHLTECDGCQNYLSQMRSTIHTTSELPPETASGELDDRLLSIYRQWLQSQARQ